ncbi:MAG: 16S rRNA (guanine(527)-N(7))-methyltransferase RsmG [Actinobacteria bacterium]|jgi:16S rRNA (guanine527-N7)-methyltransferase|nr:16S rRNA (guanine(527)-N(7))-methyltransferase RsmG [Actinomycetota bacterium]
MKNLSVSQRTALERFASSVETSPHNLVSRRARAELRTRHVPESVAFARWMPPGPARVLDLGSGGGFPGLVVALVRPDLQVELLDSTSKKTAFLREMAADLQLSVTVHTGRAEDLAKGDLGAAFDAVTARAVASLDRLVGLAVPFLRPGGALYAIKGERWAEEIEAATPVLRRVGARVAATPDESSMGPGDSQVPRVVSIVRT